MRWIYVLERRFGHLAIPGLIRIVVMFNVLVYLLMLSGRREFVEMLTLRPDRVMAGEVWRLVSLHSSSPSPSAGGGANNGAAQHPARAHVLQLPLADGGGSGTGLGQFPSSTCSILVGMGGDDGGRLLFPVGRCHGVVPEFVAVFFAFATLFPNFPILLFFIIPVPAKWIALVSFGFTGLAFVDGSTSIRLAIFRFAGELPCSFSDTNGRGFGASRGAPSRGSQQFQMAARNRVRRDIAPLQGLRRDRS